MAKLFILKVQTNTFSKLRPNYSFRRINVLMTTFIHGFVLGSTQIGTINIKGDCSRNVA